ncbi:hypothetical protein C7H85_09635 [Zobellella endophytica]|uniref:Uncharacterized protein n=1 Tax=Zobellella endophytica TaxID=2116700 RepID=A0A2P7R5Y9_9GAMM|nr:hypothetical protein [Zobellella endophytica]PSJ45635.1 hypothetical protein C7H85_09635 [Zobellella endophytica]
MRKVVSALLAGVLALASGAALASSCPAHMAAIDAKLAENPMLSAEDAAKVAELRAEGEAKHNAGEHAESMRLLAEAEQILGI